MSSTRSRAASLWKATRYPLAFLTLPLLVGLCAAAAYLHSPAPPPPEVLATPAPPTLNPARPTVAVALGRDLTEVSDALAPYAVFAAAGAFNVVTVAETRRPVSLSGDLDVLPHFTFDQLDALLGRGPDLIVVPNVPHLQTNVPLLRWVRKHGHTHSLVMGVCVGAELLAATGLLDGRPATTHWGDIDRIEQNYPEVDWVRGQRYVDDGQVMTTAGILSGMDGALHMVARLGSPALADQVAQQLHYDARFSGSTAMEQLHLTATDTLLGVLNAMYRWDRPTLGVALFDGVDELALAALYDTVVPAMVGRLVSVAPPGAVVTSRHGLNLVARRTPGQWPLSSPLLIAGEAGPGGAPDWTAPYRRQPASAAGRFAFDTALAGLARRADRPTAQLAAKRLESRQDAGHLPGRGWATSSVVSRPLLLGVLAVVLLWALEQAGTLPGSARTPLMRSLWVRQGVPGFRRSLTTERRRP